MKTQRKKSIIQERKVARDLDAVPVVASGAFWSNKGDVRHDTLLVECKTTEKSFYSLSFKVWDKIEKEAVKDGLRTPVMCIYLEDGNKKFAVFKREHFSEYERLSEMFLGDHFIRKVDKSSFRVYAVGKVFVTSWGSRDYEFYITTWDDFLYLIKE